MRVGLSSYTYTWSVGVPGHPPAQPLTAHQLLDRAAQLNVQVVQIADNLPLHQMPLQTQHDLAGHARRLGIQVEVGTRGIAQDHLSEYLAIAELFGSPILRVVIDGPTGRYSPEAATDVLRAQRRSFEDAGVVLAVENHDRFPATVLARMVQELGPHWVGVCLDTANSLAALEGTATVLDVLGPWTVNVHLKDVQVVRLPHMMGFTVEGRPAGQGQVDLFQVLTSVAAHKRRLPGGCELSAILELWTPPEDATEMTIAKEARWAEESLRFLMPLLEPASRPPASLPQRGEDAAPGPDQAVV